MRIGTTGRLTALLTGLLLVTSTGAASAASDRHPASPAVRPQASAWDPTVIAISSAGPQFTQDYTQRVVDVAAWSTADRARVHMWDYRTDGNLNNQRWKVVLTYLSDNSFEIVNINSGKCLDKSMDHGDINGAPVFQYTCTGFANQLWSFTDTTRFGFKQIRNAEDNRCLDISQFVNANDADVQVWDCNSTGWNQAWYLRG